MLSKKIALLWSGGKDSSYALYHLLQQDYEVVALLCTLSEEHKRVSIHGLSEKLLDAQSAQIKIPLQKIYIKDGLGSYEQGLGQALKALRAQGVQQIASGDIFLEDVRAYRSALIESHGLEAVYPLWGKDTHQLGLQFIRNGFASVLCSVQPPMRQALGAVYNKDLLESLPQGVDPCGEHGEFHTFCFQGPVLAQPIAYTLGKVIQKTYTLHGQDSTMWFIDVQ